MWRTLSRGLDDIEKVQENAAKMLNITEKDCYRDTEIISWRAILKLSGMFQGREQEDIIKNIYGKPLSSDLGDFTATTENKMDEYWAFVSRNNNFLNIKY